MSHSFLYAQGDGIFQEWKKRFFALVYRHKYLLCCYTVNGTSPKKVIPLDGYTIDYSDTTSSIQGTVLASCAAYLKSGDNFNRQGHDDGGQLQFVMVKEDSKLHFGVKESNERLSWLQSLTRATGQSYKPSLPDSTPNNEGQLLPNLILCNGGNVPRSQYLLHVFCR